jgi:alkanesulfonate monooxygenase SsuD/methylene tetrahydromethanopterin reductase-like flavin-dependent oxidoreductase (luciferase family)
VAPHLLYQFNRYREWGGGQTIESADQLPRDRYIVGSPAEVVTGVQALIDRTGCDRLFFWARPPGLSIDLANRSIERFAKEVMPHIRG